MDRPANTDSYRSAVYAQSGMCASSQSLATVSGLDVLKRGGSAADAAINMLNTLTVVEPFMNGLGGDMFGLYFDASKNELAGINSSGPAPAGLSIKLLKSLGHKEMPQSGPLTVTVPGALAGISELHNRYGKLCWEDLFQQAIKYAEGGFPLSEIISYEWHAEIQLLKDNPETAHIYLPLGHTPRPGEVFRNQPLADTLKLIANKGAQTFYRGELCEKICTAMTAAGSPLTVDDFSGFTPEWVDPISVNYKGREVFALPPNCQGITVLEMLRMLDGFDFKKMGLNSSEYIHTLVEAKKYAFLDRDTKIADPGFMTDDFHKLLSDQNINSFKEQFNPVCASEFSNKPLHCSNTVYVVAVDEKRNVASFISSIYDHFGSGIVAGDTGILMQNRGSLFSFDKNHPNSLKPGKRPLHTIIPSIVFKNKKPEFAFGVMGGHMQPQGQVQILNNMYVFGLGIQEASDQSRFFHDGSEICLESGIPFKTERKLIEKGHKTGTQIDVFGGFQGIWIDHDNDVLIGGSDLRKDGCAIGY
ncbi:MAG: gamma-glutamyltransferase [Desulfobacterales bacterium]|nr:gamma-glutamyltransferase [Desulfobacterales bacterium]